MCTVNGVPKAVEVTVENIMLIGELTIEANCNTVHRSGGGGGGGRLLLGAGNSSGGDQEITVADNIVFAGRHSQVNMGSNNHVAGLRGGGGGGGGGGGSGGGDGRLLLGAGNSSGDVVFTGRRSQVNMGSNNYAGLRDPDLEILEASLARKHQKVNALKTRQAQLRATMAARTSTAYKYY